ncbi:MAG: AAA family ATPase [Lentisphaerae bacterium]|nr:AAA family ATPase [Lentisphaerota bacterium]MBT4823178.1 AAA family ATPase [Lentisphaerota bacterium]MBT5607224.1 AAA family ATPase [Lentisphaerota bacterium]MBT7054249.1 AAA family ATPase [Lentisphaerota bacterium]MBT7842650.1 AAA family ATPase [Lentisphaerota bacterium]
MITSITIENFKGIGSPVTVSLRPITLLFGKNSAGKSTILQALHYLREILEHRRPDPDRTRVGGDTVDLGGFHALVHRNETERRIRIRATFALDADGIPFEGVETAGGRRDDSVSRRGWLRQASREDLQHLLDLGLASGRAVDLNGLGELDSAWIEVVTAWDAEENAAYIAEYGVGINGHEIIRLAQPPGMVPQIVSMDFDHPLLLALDEEEPDTPVCSQRYKLWSLFEDDVESDVPGQFSQPVFLSAQQSLVPEHGKPYLVDETFDWEYEESSSSPDDEDTATRFLFWSIVGQTLTGPLTVLLGDLRGIRYTGPIRSVPPRNHRSPKTPDESRWANGLGAWDALIRDPALAEKTSHYLQDVLGLGYSLRREDRIHIDADGDVMAALRMFGARYEEMTESEYRQLVLAPLESRKRTPAIQLHDERNGIDVDPSDIGVGVSQVLPVAVGALDRGTAESPCRIFAIEQPELHVHPAVQVALGEAFIEAVSNSDRMMLIETHSEHLLLRLLRRVRESQDAQERTLSPDQLSVVYVRPTDHGVELTRLEVNAGGDFDTEWPEGFFEERFDELFGGEE